MNAFSANAALIVMVVLAGGCSALVPKAELPPALYTLDTAAAPGAQARLPTAGTTSILVEVPRAGPGQGSAHLMYMRESHRLEYYAHSEWVDTPSRMLAPLIVGALQRQQVFAAVLAAPASATAGLRLETEILRLQQDFGVGPSRLRFALRATLVDNRSHQVLAQREFEQAVAADSEDARGAVSAAQLAVQGVLEALARLCAESAGLPAGHAP